MANRRFALLSHIHNGITDANLVDKTSGETITGLWTFNNDLIIAEGSDLALAGGSAGRVRAESKTIADDATDTFTTQGTYKMCFLVVSFNPTAMAHFGVASTQAPVNYGSGSNVSMGATNPDIDTDVNIWPSSTNEISIKNRMGSSRIFTLYTFSL